MSAIKKVFPLIVFTAISGCASFPNKSVDNLEAPNGKGALAMMTSFSQSNSNRQPCHKFTLEMHQKLGDDKLSPQPNVLSFHPNADKNYILFDQLTPGDYVIKALRCYPRPGYVFNGNLKFLEEDVWSEQSIKANKLTLSKEAFSGMAYSNGSFLFNFKASDNNAGFLDLIIDDESKIGWSVYVPEDALETN